MKGKMYKLGYVELEIDRLSIRWKRAEAYIPTSDVT